MSAAAQAGAAGDPDRPGWVWAEDELAWLNRETARLVTQLLLDGRTGAVTQRLPHGLIEAWATMSWPDRGVVSPLSLPSSAPTLGGIRSGMRILAMPPG